MLLLLSSEPHRLNITNFTNFSQFYNSSNSLFGDHATAQTPALWPVRRCENPPEVTSQSKTSGSALPTATKQWETAAGDMATVKTGDPMEKELPTVSELASHTFT